MGVEHYFDHEKLRVYQRALEFVSWWSELSTRCSNLPSLRDQMDRASTSIVLNIAEGNGRFSAKGKGRFLQISYASALECASCLDVLLIRKRLSMDEVAQGNAPFAKWYRS